LVRYAVIGSRSFRSSIEQNEAQHERLEARIETLRNDPLDGWISSSFYDAKAGEIRAKKQALPRKIEQIWSNAPAPMEDTLDFMRLTGRAATLRTQQRRAKREREHAAAVR
jgi:hypothetical protein